MLNSLRIRNYKALKDFNIVKLGRLNLIVGKNNSGKSTVLESIRILAAQGNPSLINEIIVKHDDQILVQKMHDIVKEDDDSLNVYQGLFSDRVFPLDDSSIFIGSNDDKDFVEIKRVFFEDETTEKTDDKGSVSIRTRKIYTPDESKKIGNLEQTIQIISNQYKDKPLYLDNSTIDLYRRRPINFPDYIKTIPVSFIPTQFLSMDLLADLWDKTILTDYYNNVKDFLKFISDDLEDIAFIKVNHTRFYREREIERTGITKLRKHPQPIPLNSMGDGVMRILQLVLGIFPSSGGILLIDEFENGLHFSIQEHLWEAIFKLAKELNIQVFATTHSWDCIEAFTQAAHKNNDDAVLCKIAYGLGENKNRIISTVYEKEDILNLTQADVELR
jgi:AAA15 family ATPase/GTPase